MKRRSAVGAIAITAAACMSIMMTFFGAPQAGSSNKSNSGADNGNSFSSTSFFQQQQQQQQQETSVTLQQQQQQQQQPITLHPSNSNNNMDQLHQKQGSYAFVFYAARPKYYCSVLINIHRLQRLSCGKGRNIDFVILHPDDWKPPSNLKKKAIHQLRVKHVPVPRLLLGSKFTLSNKSSRHYYYDCMTKLHVFNQTQYDRVVFMDADAIVVQCFDELFDLPVVDVAGSRTYWLKPGRLNSTKCTEGWDEGENGPALGLQMKFSSALMVVKPSKRVWSRLYDKYWNGNGEPSPLLKNLYDMDLLNNEFKDEVMLLPPIMRVTEKLWAEADGHGPDEDMSAPFRGARIMHFSWPEKPWIWTPEDFLNEYGNVSHPDVTQAWNLWWEGSRAMQCPGDVYGIARKKVIGVNDNDNDNDGDHLGEY